MAICTHNKTVIIDDITGSIQTRNDGELFWALRGGGGGTFGIVVHYVLKLHPAPNAFVKATFRGTLYQNNSDAHVYWKVIETYQEWVKSAPSYWYGSLILVPGSVIIARFFKPGPWDRNTTTDLMPFIEFQSHYQQLVSIELNNITTSVDHIFTDDAHQPAGHSFRQKHLMQLIYRSFLFKN